MRAFGPHTALLQDAKLLQDLKTLLWAMIAREKNHVRFFPPGMRADHIGKWSMHVL